MERVAQRTKAAIRQVARRKARQDAHTKGSESWERAQSFQRQRRNQTDLIQEARQNRKEDWERGLLAPRRDVGLKRDSYGTLSIYNIQAPEKNPEERLDWWPITEQDRVVVIRGREKGKIGIVSSVYKDSVTITIRGMNTVEVKVPEWMQRQNEHQDSVVPVPYAIPLSDVRLIYPLPHPETGVPRDVVIDRLVPVKRVLDKKTRKLSDGQRMIAGTNIIIPWQVEEKPEAETHEADTDLLSTEERTFRPVLLEPPMPLSVIDELRNKYSKFRTRHDWDYVRDKDLEELKAEKRKELAEKMKTPKQQMRDLKIKEGEAAREKELSNEQLAMIGQVIAAQQAKVRGTVAGLS